MPPGPAAPAWPPSAGCSQTPLQGSASVSRTGNGGTEGTGTFLYPGSRFQCLILTSEELTESCANQGGHSSCGPLGGAVWSLPGAPSQEEKGDIPPVGGGVSPGCPYRGGRGLLRYLRE